MPVQYKGSSLFPIHEIIELSFFTVLTDKLLSKDEKESDLTSSDMLGYWTTL